jgi:hypothetical protein
MKRKPKTVPIPEAMTLNCVGIRIGVARLQETAGFSFYAEFHPVMKVGGRVHIACEKLGLPLGELHGKYFGPDSARAYAAA